MKSRLIQLKNVAGRAREKAGRMLLAPWVALMCSPAFAALPTVPVPGEAVGGGTVADGDWLGAMGAWFKAGVIIFSLILAALAFIYVMMGALGKWRNYSMGRLEMADLKEYFIMGAVLAVFIVVMATYAAQVLA